MLIFLIFIAFVIAQRLVELVIAKRNEKWMKRQGAKEFGSGHYRCIVLIHSLFFLVYIAEVLWKGAALSTWWPLLLAAFLLTQAARVWALVSLGKYWNTKIIVLPKADVVVKGPYRFIKHPNYVIVGVEFIVIPLMFNAFITAVVFSILNVLILSIRIPEEEKALKSLTEYDESFKGSGRFIP